MPKYTILAKREIRYEFIIEAESEEEALEEINRIEISEDVEEYAYSWNALEVESTEVES
jgi:hypothetical protein